LKRHDLLLVAGACVVMLGVCGYAPSARATPQYPGTIDQALAVSCQDPLSRCLICHTTALGGKTAYQPFIETLRTRYGFARANDPNGLRTVLGLLGEDVDSDADGVSDKAELRACANPSGDDLGRGPEYGCDGASLARPAPSGQAAWLGGAACVLLGFGLVRHRRAQARARAALLQR
jgi:hypothetical protein